MPGRFVAVALCSLFHSFATRIVRQIETGVRCADSRAFSQSTKNVSSSNDWRKTRSSIHTLCSTHSVMIMLSSL